uniref:Symplekin n=1 Tax=Oryza punctata TaxID=4537 RepID=A0A0E0JMS3_ORYPU
MEFEADGARWPEPRGDAAGAPPLERGDAPSPRFDSSRALRLLRELGSNVTEDLVVLMPNLLSFLKHDDPAVVNQSIASGTNLFAAVLEEMTLQINKCGKVDAWLEEMWAWMKQFKDAVHNLIHESVPVATKLFAIKFIETWILCFTPQSKSDRMQPIEGRNRRFDSSRLSQFHPSLNPAVLEADANRALILLVDILQSACAHQGSFLVGTINSLAAIAKNRPVYYERILPVLLGFDPGLEVAKGAHPASLRYSLKTAFLGFLRSPCQAMIESKDTLVRQLRVLSPGEATEQIIRQAEKMTRNIERASRASKDEPSTLDMPYGDISRKYPAARSSDAFATADGVAKRARFDTSAALSPPFQGASDYSNMQVDNEANVGHSSDPALLNSDMSPVEKMIEMIGALLAEGERGAESLGILISTVEADVMADIVIETMKHLPETSILLATSNNGQQKKIQSSSSPLTENLPANSQSLPYSTQFTLPADGVSMSMSDVPVVSGAHDSKRDPRRDPRRLDPRRTVAPAATSSIHVKGEATGVHQTNNLSNVPYPVSGKVENSSDYSGDLSKNEDVQQTSFQPNQALPKENCEILDDALELEPKFEVQAVADVGFHSSDVDKEMVNPLSPEISSNNELDSVELEVDPFSPVLKASTPEDTTNHDLPVLPSHLELSDDEKILFHKLAIRRIIDDYKKNSLNTRFSLLAHLISQSAADDNIMDLIQRHIIYHYHDQGHELAMHVLYQLHSVNIADSPESTAPASKNYENFFISLARSLIHSLPASDKSFSKFLCDAPYLPESMLKLLEDICVSQGNSQQTKESDGDRVTQGLGTVWSLILARPPLRQDCLDIALKFAIDSLLAIANKHGVETDINFTSSKDSSPEFEAGRQETSVCGSHISDAEPSASTCNKTDLVSPKQSAVSVSEAKRHTSLFFALCTKRPILLQHLFNVYGRTPKVVKQCIHWHIPNLVRNLGSSCSEMLAIIHNPPEGSEELVTLILQTLTEDSTPSAELVAAVKHLYETKLKVLPIFPRLVDLPPDRFQDALARILQGSAHTGPALTPAEVLIAIHDINPEKDKVALKKVTDACTACFEQRTVDNVPIPLLFMRTVIQALDAFPALVDFVMEILSRLVNKQIWKMPKLWVGFLKLAYQTQPRSFDVILQRNMHSFLPRQILKVLGFINEPQQAPIPFVPAALQTADATSSLPGATLM